MTVKLQRAYDMSKNDVNRKVTDVRMRKNTKQKIENIKITCIYSGWWECSPSGHTFSGFKRTDNALI